MSLASFALHTILLATSTSSSKVQFEMSNRWREAQSSSLPMSSRRRGKLPDSTRIHVEALPVPSPFAHPPPPPSRTLDSDNAVLRNSKSHQRNLTAPYVSGPQQGARLAQAVVPDGDAMLQNTVGTYQKDAEERFNKTTDRRLGLRLDGVCADGSPQ